MPDRVRSQASNATVGSLEDSDTISGGFGEWVQNSTIMIILGAALVVAGCAALAWNEGQAVSGARSVEEARAMVVEVPAGKPDPSVTGKLVYVSGPVTSTAGVIDPDIGMTRKGLRLARTVEMLQWTQTESGSGQDRKFVYKTEWRDQAVNSATFNEPSRYNNPRFPVIRSRVYAAQDAVIGDYPLGPAALVALEGGEELPVGPKELELAKAATGRSAVLIPGGFYFGEGPDAPRVGDWRAVYRLLPEGPASFIARQGSLGLERYRGEKGETILLAAPGILTASDLLSKGISAYTFQFWSIRIGSGLLLFVGFVCAFAPAQALARLAPALGSRVAGATLATATAATLLAGSCALAAVWVAQRPLQSVSLLAIGVVSAVALWLVSARRRNSSAAA